MVAASDEPEVKDPFLRDLIGKRNAMGLTTRTLGEKLGVSATLISLIESGQKIPSENLASKWAELIDINPKIFVAWARSKHTRDPRTTMLGEAEYSYFQDNPKVRVEVADTSQISFDFMPPDKAEDQRGQAKSRPEPGEGVVNVPLIPEGIDPATDLVPLEYVTVREDLLKGERLVRPFAYRISSQGMRRVFKTLYPGDCVVINREVRSLERDEIYAVRYGRRVILSRVIEKGSDMLLLLSDQGEEDIDALRAEGGKVRSLIVGKVVAAIRPLRYSVVKPSGGREK